MYTFQMGMGVVNLLFQRFFASFFLLFPAALIFIGIEVFFEVMVGVTFFTFFHIEWLLPESFDETDLFAFVMTVFGAWSILSIVIEKLLSVQLPAVSSTLNTGMHIISILAWGALLVKQDASWGMYGIIIAFHMISYGSVAAYNALTNYFSK